MRVLVTGATGFVGGQLVPGLLEHGHEVVAVGRRAPAAGADWIDADLSRPLRPASLPQRYDALIHLAQSPRYRDFPAGAEDVFAVNVAATAALVDHAVRASATHVVHASTGSVYARSSAAVTEATPPRPPDFYAASKLAAETLLAPYREVLLPVVLRPFFIYGAGRSEMLLARLAERVVAGERITVTGDRGLLMNPIHVTDAARAFVGALDATEPGPFNLAGGEVAGLAEIVRMLGELAGREPVIDRQPGEDTGLVADITRLRDALGFTPAVGLRDGLRELVAR